MLTFHKKVDMRENNIKIPEDISLCAIGDSKFSSLINPKLTTIQYYYKESGIKSSRILIDILRGNCNKEDLKSIKLGYNFSTRESVKV